MLGAVEAHGPHLPLETDTIIGLHVARAAAARIASEHGVPVEVAEPFVETTAHFARDHPGTVSVPPDEEARALAARIRTHLEGARTVLLVTLHFDPVHLGAVQAALDALAAEDRSRVVYPELTRRARVERIGGEFATGSCHGGAFETSLVLVAAPEAVNPSFRELADEPVDLLAAIREGKDSFREIGMGEAYCGWPSRASAEEGERLTRVIADLLVEAWVEARGA